MLDKSQEPDASLDTSPLLPQCQDAGMAVVAIVVFNENSGEDEIKLRPDLAASK